MKINFFGDKIIIRHKITFFGFGKKLKTTLNMECEKQQMEAEKKEITVTMGTRIIMRSGHDLCVT